MIETRGVGGSSCAPLGFNAMRLDDVAYTKWQKWMIKVERDLTRLIDNQQIFLKFSEVVNENAEHIYLLDRGVFVGFVWKCYVDQAVMGIRRHLKTRNAISLTRVIWQVHECADQFTYEFYLRQFPKDRYPVNWQTPAFGRFSDDGQSISRRIVELHLETVDRLNEEIRRFANRAIAHLDKRKFKGKVTLEDLRKSIDTFNRLACKYLSLISGKGYSTLEPTITVNWTEVFYSPLSPLAKIPREES